MPSRSDSARVSAARRYEAHVDPEGLLDPATRAAFVEVARWSHVRRMTRNSVATRQARASARRGGLAA